MRKPRSRPSASAGFEILGLDLRRYPTDGGTFEASWSSLKPSGSTTNLEEALRSLEAAVDSELTDYPWVLITYRSAKRLDSESLVSDLTDGEVELLIDGLTDDVAFDMALIHFGIRGNPPDGSEPPHVSQIDTAFHSC